MTSDTPSMTCRYCQSPLVRGGPQQRLCGDLIEYCKCSNPACLGTTPLVVEACQHARVARVSIDRLGDMAVDVRKYSYRVIWSQDDEEHVGLCSEFPSLSHLAPDQLEALQGIHDLVESVCADMEAAGDPLPEPLAMKATFDLHNGSSSSRSVVRVRCVECGRIWTEHQDVT